MLSAALIMLVGQSPTVDQEIWSEVARTYSKGTKLEGTATQWVNGEVQEISFRAARPSEFNFKRGEEEIRWDGQALFRTHVGLKEFDRYEPKDGRPFGMWETQWGLVGQFAPGAIAIFGLYGLESFFLPKVSKSFESSAPADFEGNSAIGYKFSFPKGSLTVFIDRDRKVLLGWSRTEQADPGGDRPKDVETKLVYTKLLLDGKEQTVFQYQSSNSRVSAEYAGAAIGSQAPDFKLPFLDGRDLSLHAMWQEHKATVIKFWWLGCPPCVEGYPSYAELAKEINGRGASLISLDIFDEDPALIKKFVSGTAPEVPVALGYGQRVQLMRKFGVTSFPTTVVIDSEGKIRDRIVGDDYPRLRRVLTALGVL